MVVDSSAVLAVLFNEPERDMFSDALADAGVDCWRTDGNQWDCQRRTRREKIEEAMNTHDHGPPREWHALATSGPGRGIPERDVRSLALANLLTTRVGLGQSGPVGS